MILFEYGFERIEVLHYDLMIGHGKDGAPCTRSFHFTTHVDAQLRKGVSYVSPIGYENYQRILKGINKMTH